MKISKSKQELARIISENGGWRNGNYAVQDKDDKKVWFMRALAGRPDGASFWPGVKSRGIPYSKVLTNWHQTILSRAEYLHLYPAPDADGWIEWGGGECPVEDDAIIDIRFRYGHEERGVDADWDWEHSGGGDIIAYRLHKPEQECATNKLSSEAVSAAKIALMGNSIEELVRKPTIEQLADDYRNRKDYATRKQQEADEAKTAADAALGELERAGETLGLVIGVAKPEPEPRAEPELVITDWRDLLERDTIWFGGDGEQAAGEYSVLEVEHSDYGGNRAVRIDTVGNDYWIDVTDDWKFIRRP